MDDIELQTQVMKGRPMNVCSFQPIFQLRPEQT